MTFRSLLYPFSIAGVVALGFWAYQEGYETRATERAVASLERQIAERERDLAMLRAEWAYLNRPDRLAALAELNWGTLGLMPLTGGHFGRAAEVPAAPVPMLVAGRDLSDAVTGIADVRFAFGPDDGAVVIGPAEAPAATGEQVP